MDKNTEKAPYEREVAISSTSENITLENRWKELVLALITVSQIKKQSVFKCHTVYLYKLFIKNLKINHNSGRIRWEMLAVLVEIR